MSDKTLSTTCPMDCPDSCSLNVTVIDGKLEKIAAGQDHPNTNGFICTKVSRFDRRVYSPHRLKTPLKNIGSKDKPEFIQISWQRAVDEITSKHKDILHNWGGEAILPCNYGGSNGFISDEFTDALFFAKIGASRLGKTLCAVPTTLVTTGMYGKMPGVAFEDFVHAKMIIIWGANPGKSNTHLIPYLKEAHNRGAFIAVIDPINNFSSNMIDLHLPVRPGTDLPLALSLINHWSEKSLIDHRFVEENTINAEILLKKANHWTINSAAEVCGIDANKIKQLADEYAKRSPALIRCGWGLERNINGGQAIASILAIPALMGKFGIRAGGYTLSNSGFLGYKRKHSNVTTGNKIRTLNMTQLGKILNDTELNPPVKALFIYNSNPVATIPDQNAIINGLKRDDLFTVVFDQVMTDSAQFANIILPATTFFEHHDIRRSYGTYYYGKISPVIDAVGESKSNHEVFSLLGNAMGWNDKLFDEPQENLSTQIESEFQYYKNITNPKTSLINPVQFETVFPATSTGIINITPDELGPNPFEFSIIENEKYPFILISPATEKTINSTLGEFNLPEQLAEINPKDAVDKDIQMHDLIKINNELGEVKCKAIINKNVREGVVVLPKGAWRKSSLNGSTATALCPSHVNIVGGAACYNDARVQVTKLT